MTTKERHYRAIPARILHSARVAVLRRGYERGNGRPLDFDPVEFFRGRRYCLEDYEAIKESTGELEAYVIGYLLGREDREKAPAQGDDELQEWWRK